MRALDLMLHPDFERGITVADNKVYGQIFLNIKEQVIHLSESLYFTIVVTF